MTTNKLYKLEAENSYLNHELLKCEKKVIIYKQCLTLIVGIVAILGVLLVMSVVAR
jgi:hypothetical protein